MALVAQAGDQVIVGLNCFSFAAAPIYVRGADCPIVYSAVLAGNRSAGFQQRFASNVFLLRIKH